MYKMEPVSDFDEISKEILKNYRDGEVITIGILLADGQQDEAKQYIINYMDRFDRKSGKYIDFYIPGYYELNTENVQIHRKYHPNSYFKRDEVKKELAFYIRRNQTAYYFDKFLFDDFIEEMNSRMGIEYTYNPMLILVEVNMNKNRGNIEFQDKMVIELDEDSNRGLRRSGQLFDEIFSIAKQQVKLDRFEKDVRMYYIKGKAVENFIRILSGSWLEAVTDIVSDVHRFRIK
ncbi:MAG: hypothetical protein IJ716_12205 [Lachnospiraceae bacterium]|nr:hypothetical protein [Lachnospiraceae bacterium]